MRVFKSGMIREQLSAEALAALEYDFRSYKTTGTAPIGFGRDAPYDHPSTPRILLLEDVRHIHLKQADGWPERLIQYKRTSDDHLVYCTGSLQTDVFLLIGLLSPDAHDQIKDFSVALKLGEIAERFRQQF